MASGFSTAYSTTMLDHIFRAQSAPTFPATTWVAAFTVSNAASFLKVNDPTSAVEVAGGIGYNRLQIMSGSAIVFTAASSGQITLGSDIVWNAASANWGTIYAVALMTASTAGSVLCYGDLNTPRSITTSDILRIPAGQLVIEL